MALSRKNKYQFILIAVLLSFPLFATSPDFWIYPSDVNDLIDAGTEHEDWIYQYGAQVEGKTDCSNLIQRMFKAINIDLPRSSKEQSLDRRFVEVDWENRQKGDLVYFTNGKSKKISHVGILVDDSHLLHASRKKKKVIVTKISKDGRLGKKISMIKRYRFLYPSRYMSAQFYF